MDAENVKKKLTWSFKVARLGVKNMISLSLLALVAFFKIDNV